MQKKDIFEFDLGEKMELPPVIVVVKCVLFVLLTFFLASFLSLLLLLLLFLYSTLFIRLLFNIIMLIWQHTEMY